MDLWYGRRRSILIWTTRDTEPLNFYSGQCSHKNSLVKERSALALFWTRTTLLCLLKMQTARARRVPSRRSAYSPCSQAAKRRKLRAHSGDRFFIWPLEDSSSTISLRPLRDSFVVFRVWPSDRVSYSPRHATQDPCSRSRTCPKPAGRCRWLKFVL